MIYRVKERRAYDVEYIIEAPNEEAARSLDGEVWEEVVGDSFGYELLGVEQVEDPETLKDIAGA